MAHTIPGGAYETPGGWVDCNGQPITSDQVAEARKLAAAHAKVLADADAETNARALAARPEARAIAAAMEQAMAPKAKPAAKTEE